MYMYMYMYIYRYRKYIIFYIECDLNYIAIRVLILQLL